MVWIVRRRSVWLKPHVSILSIPILEDKIDKLTLLLIMLVVSVLDRRYQRPMNSSSAHLSTHAVYKISVHTWTTLRTTACCFGCTEKLITFLMRHCLKIIDPVTNMYPDPGNGLHSRECLCSRCWEWALSMTCQWYIHKHKGCPGEGLISYTDYARMNNQCQTYITKWNKFI